MNKYLLIILMILFKYLTWQVMSISMENWNNQSGPMIQFRKVSLKSYGQNVHVKTIVGETAFQMLKSMRSWIKKVNYLHMWLHLACNVIHEDEIDVLASHPLHRSQQVDCIWQTTEEIYPYLQTKLIKHCKKILKKKMKKTHYCIPPFTLFHV